MGQRLFASSRIATDRQRVNPALLTREKQILGALGVLGGFLFELVLYPNPCLNNSSRRESLLFNPCSLLKASADFHQRTLHEPLAVRGFL